MKILQSELFHEIKVGNKAQVNNKLTIVGIEAVGMAAAFSILAQVRKSYQIFKKFSSSK